MSYNIDIAYIVKRLKDFKRGIITFDSLLDGIIIDLNIKGNKDKIDKLKTHLEALESELEDGYIKDSELKSLAYEMFTVVENKDTRLKIKLTTEQIKLVKSFAKKLIEARDDKYADYVVKKDKIIATVSAQKGAAFTALAKSWKQLDKKVDELAAKKTELNDLKKSIEADETELHKKIKEKVVSIFDDSESAMTLTVECLNSSFTLSQLTDENNPTKIASKGDQTQTDYKKVIELLLEQNKDLEGTVNALIKQCSIIATEDIWKPGAERRLRVKVDPSITSESLLREGLWDNIVSFISKLGYRIKQYFGRLRNRQQKINQQLILLKSK